MVGGGVLAAAPKKKIYKKKKVDTHPEYLPLLFDWHAFEINRLPSLKQTKKYRALAYYSLFIVLYNTPPCSKVQTPKSLSYTATTKKLAAQKGARAPFSRKKHRINFPAHHNTTHSKNPLSPPTKPPKAKTPRVHSQTYISYFLFCYPPFLPSFLPSFLLKQQPNNNNKNASRLSLKYQHTPSRSNRRLQYVGPFA